MTMGQFQRAIGGLAVVLISIWIIEQEKVGKGVTWVYEYNSEGRVATGVNGHNSVSFSVMTTSIMFFSKRVRGRPTEAVNCDKFRYQAAFTYPIPQAPEEISDIDYTRY